MTKTVGRVGGGGALDPCFTCANLYVGLNDAENQVTVYSRVKMQWQGNYNIVIGLVQQKVVVDHVALYFGR